MSSENLPQETGATTLTAAETLRQTKANHIKWSKNVVLTMQSLDDNSEPIKDYVVESARYTGATVDLVEVNDVTEDKMDKDYVVGMRDGGTLDLTVRAVYTELKEGTRWKLGMKVDNAVVFKDKYGIITQSQSVDVQGGQLASTSLQIKVLPNNSRLAVANVIENPTA